jgi:integrase
MGQPKLLEAVHSVARLRHLSLGTGRAYSDWIRRFILFHKKRHPKEMGADEIRQFLSHLAVEGRVAASTQNVALCALLFLYRDVPGVGLPYVEVIERAKRPARVPVVFTRSEVTTLLSKLSGTYKLIAGLLYGSGLRLMEALRLRVKDLDFHTCEITVRDGKGEKDRRSTRPEDAAQEPLAQASRRHPAQELYGRPRAAQTVLRKDTGMKM